VETYIQTGNVRFRTTMRSTARVEKRVEDVLAEHCGFDVPAIVLTPAELSEVYDDACGIPDPGFANPRGRRYVIFFKAGAAPDGQTAKDIAAWAEPGESAAVIGRAVHIWLGHASQEAKFFGAFKKALAPGTNRDLKVVTELAARWGASP